MRLPLPNDPGQQTATDGGIFENKPPLGNSPAVKFDQAIKKPILTSDALRHAQAVPAPDRLWITNEVLGPVLAALSSFERQMQGVRDRLHYEPFVVTVAANANSPLTMVNNSRVMVLTLHAPSTNSGATILTLTEDISAPPLLSTSLAAGALLTDLHLPFRSLFGSSSVGNVIVAGYVRW